MTVETTAWFQRFAASISADRSLGNALGNRATCAMVTEPKAVIEELFRRRASGDDSVIDEFIAENMVNHAAGPQGREGWKQILAVIATDLGDDIAIENHRFIAEGEFVAQHMTLHGRHRASTMPLLAGVKPNDLEASWTYIHIWRVVDGKVVEHWACRDDVGLLRQLGAWPTPTP